MKTVLGYRVSPFTISITFDEGSPASITKDHVKFDEIADKLRRGDHAGIEDLIRPVEAIKSYLNGKVEVQGSALRYEGEAINHSLVPTILQMVKDDQDPDLLLRFLDLLMQNPSFNSRKQLWQFIEKNGISLYSGPVVAVANVVLPDATVKPMPGDSIVDPTGWLVLYKGVDPELKDCHTHKFDNSPGNLIMMDRAKVDDDVNSACSSGFHAGAFEYVQSFGQRKLLVLVNPRDVVSVPHDSSAQKVRVCEYVVLKELPVMERMDVVYDADEDDHDEDEYHEGEDLDDEEELDPEFRVDLSVGGKFTAIHVRAKNVQHASQLAARAHNANAVEVLSVNRV